MKLVSCVYYNDHEVSGYSLSRREESSKHKLSDFLIVCPQGQKNIENRF